MITDSDIGQLFSIMRAAYGNTWPHQADAIPVWFTRFGGFNRDELFRAADAAIQKYPDFPPTLGQFDFIISGPPQRASTYLPAPQMSRQRKMVNKILMNVLMEVGGVDKRQLDQLVRFKNTMISEIEGNHPSLEWTHDCHRQLTEMALTTV